MRLARTSVPRGRARPASRGPGPSPAPPDAPANGRRASPAEIRVVRRFGRFCRLRIDAPRLPADGPPLSPAQGRVLDEVGHGDRPTAAELTRVLDLDQGYLSRLLAALERDGLVRRRRSAVDGRKSHLELTAAGRSALAAVERATSARVAEMVDPLPAHARRRLVRTLREVQRTLSGEPGADEPCRVRGSRAGDLGWIVERHGARRDRDGETSGEAAVVRIVADFAERADAERERCLIAVRGGERVGSALVEARTSRVAHVRLLHVEPESRGRGVGRRLVDACVAFARRADYRRVEIPHDAGRDVASHVLGRAGFRRARAARRGDPGAWTLDLSAR